LPWRRNWKNTAMSIRERIESIRERMEKAALRVGRKAEEIRLMGVSKFHEVPEIEEAIDAGLVLFGESRVQEAAQKFPSLKEKHPGIELHLIGSLQRNKAKYIPALFDTVQSVDRDELITALGNVSAENTAADNSGTTANKPKANTPLEVLLELHTGEESKSGYPDLDSLARGAELALSFPGLRIAGLMTMAPYTKEEQPIRKSFKALVAARDFLQSRFPQGNFSCLSMGMTNDFEIAIEEGSTLIRIGTAIFGERAS